jgi:hypothetical protein
METMMEIHGMMVEVEVALNRDRVIVEAIKTRSHDNFGL